MRKVLACLVALSLSRALFAAPPARFVEALKAGKAQTVVCYGTSLTAQSHYWVDDLRSALAARWPGQATVVNAGQSGKNAAFGGERADAGRGAETRRRAHRVLADRFAGIEKILGRPAAAGPLLRQAYATADVETKRLAAAIALVLVGDNTHLGDVVEAVRAADGRKGFDFRGLGNYGRQTAPVDYLVHTLAKSRDPRRVVPVLKPLVEQLVKADGSTARLSQVRMLTLAIEDLASAELFATFTNTLARSKTLTGWAKRSAQDVPAHDVNGRDNPADDRERTRSLVELAVARTLTRLIRHSFANSPIQRFNDSTIENSTLELQLETPTHLHSPIRPFNN